MGFGSMLTAGVVGALSFSAPALAARELLDDGPKINKSLVKCTAVAASSIKLPEPEVIVDLATSASAYICDGVGAYADIAQETASTFAAAVAFASVQCVQSGNTYANVEAKSSAVAQAKVFAAAYFSAFADAETCETCDAYAGSSGYITKWVFLEAIAKAQAKIEAYTYGSGFTLFTQVTSFQQDVEKVVVEAFSESLAAAADFKKVNGCLAWVNAGGCIWTEGHPEEQTHCIDCKAIGFSADLVSAENGIAVVDAEAMSWACGDSLSQAELHLSASALAKATAAAISFAYADCNSDGVGFACSASYTDTEVWVRAVAVSYAEAMATAFSCKPTCFGEVELTAIAIGDILVDAVTDAYAAVCANGAGHFSDVDLEVEIEKASLCAIAKATAQAVSIGNDICFAGGYVEADATQHSCPEPYY